jgi:hypothetical protein
VRELGSEAAYSIIIIMDYFKQVSQFLDFNASRSLPCLRRHKKKKEGRKQRQEDEKEKEGQRQGFGRSDKREEMVCAEDVVAVVPPRNFLVHPAAAEARW